MDVLSVHLAEDYRAILKTLLFASRFVLMLAEQHDYFFVLYIINFAAEGWLAILALLHYPSEDNMEALPDDPNNPVIYQARCSQLILFERSLGVCY